MFTFYHADRMATLKPGQKLTLNEDGLSAFGQLYWEKITQTPISAMSSGVLREYCAEHARAQLAHPWSRMCSMFAAETVEEAIDFAFFVEPKPDHPIPIYEVHAYQASRHDMNWLDFVCGIDQRILDAQSYWRGEWVDHQPEYGEKRMVRWEIVIPLPATIGRQVATIL